EFSIKGRLPESGPRYKIDVSIHKDRALLTIDTSGPALHRRGYRTGQGAAPIKETLAASMLKLAKYDGTRPLTDPFAGSCTIVIAAGMIALNIATGSNRTCDAEKWDIIPQEKWHRVRMELEDAALYDKEVEIYASDIDEHMIQIARDNAMEVGLDGNIH